MRFRVFPVSRYLEFRKLEVYLVGSLNIEVRKRRVRLMKFLN